MMLLVQLIVVLVCAGILLGIARALPAPTDPWIRWGIYAIAGLIVIVWLMGLVGFWPGAPWHYAGH